MKVQKTVLIIACLLGVPGSVMAESWATPERVARSLSGSSIEIPDTRSPNGKMALFCVSLDGTTVAAAAIATTDRKRCLAVTSSYPYGSDIRDRPSRSGLTVLWSGDSRYVAIHDSARKHSRLEVFGFDESGGWQIACPDLLKLMTEKGIIPPDPASSGEEPLEWTDDNRLLVQVRAKTKTGEEVSDRVTLRLEQRTQHVRDTHLVYIQ